MPQGGHYQPASGANHKRKTAELGGKPPPASPAAGRILMD